MVQCEFVRLRSVEAESNEGLESYMGDNTTLVEGASPKQEGTRHKETELELDVNALCGLARPTEVLKSQIYVEVKCEFVGPKCDVRNRRACRMV